MNQQATPEAPVRIAIIGAGAGGLCAAIQLRKSGFEDITIFEKTNGVGGTWHDNSYPGAACDVMSHMYSFSFDPNPDWSRHYSPQSEILSYFERVAARHGLYPLIRFETEIVDAQFDNKSGLWTLRTRSGATHTANVLIAACGQLNQPLYPKIPGIETFKGTTFHSARWNHQHDLTNERVGVIGNAASAVQFIPQIAPKVAQLGVFQRSANWVVPRNDAAYTPWMKDLFRWVPPVRTLHRWQIYLKQESTWPAFRGVRLAQFMAQSLARYRLKTQIADPELRRKLTPDYPIGCKRLLISDDYYPALTRPNVSLITDPIECITPDGVRTANGIEHRFDTLIYATGFQTTEFLTPMELKGTAGRSLREAWKEGAQAYLGVTVSGFPNLYLLYGPNTNLGHNSILFMIEAQVHYLVQCVRALRDQKLRSLDLRADVQALFNQQLQQRLAHTVWIDDCQSWYKNEHGRVTNNWSSNTISYWLRTRRLHLDDYVAVSNEKS